MAHASSSIFREAETDPWGLTGIKKKKDGTQGYPKLSSIYPSYVYTQCTLIYTNTWTHKHTYIHFNCPVLVSKVGSKSCHVSGISILPTDDIRCSS